LARLYSILHCTHHTHHTLYSRTAGTSLARLCRRVRSYSYAGCRRHNQGTYTLYSTAQSTHYTSTVLTQYSSYSILKHCTLHNPGTVHTNTSTVLTLYSHCTHTLYSHTVLTHCTHTLYSHTVPTQSRWRASLQAGAGAGTIHYALYTTH
jgi:hypothetical protein